MVSRRTGQPCALVLLALLAAGCSEDPASPYFGRVEGGPTAPDTLVINCGAEPQHLDPTLAYDNIIQQMSHALFEGLTTPDPRDLHPVQGVARSFERSDDGRIYRFHLRPEARWSDGRPVVAGDFVYSWRRLIRPEPGPIGHVDEADLGPGDALLGVRATDDRTLDVELERPTPYFIDLTSRATLVPLRQDVIEPFEARGERERWSRPENMVNNGPFVLSEWRFRYAIQMKPNPMFWDRSSVRLQAVEWQVIESAFTAMNLFKAGALDSFGSSTTIPLKSRDALVGKSDVTRFSQLFSYWYDLNTRAPPLGDARVRRALGLAVDRATLVERVLRGAGIAAAHYIPDITGGGYAESLAKERAAGVDPFAERASSPERARALLREAGFPVERDGGELRARGFPPLEVVYNGEDDTNRSVAIALQDMWRRELGVTVTLRAQEWKVMVDEVNAGRYQIARGGWIADYNHPHTFLETFRSASPQNTTGWSDPALDAALDEAARAVDPLESMRLYRRAEGLALDGSARIPLFFMTAATLVKPWVKGFYGNGQVLDLVRWMWIDPAWRSDANNPPASAPLELPPPGRLAPP